MLHQPTIEKLISMRLQGMVDALETLESNEVAHELSFEEKLALDVLQTSSFGLIGFGLHGTEAAGTIQRKTFRT